MEVEDVAAQATALPGVRQKGCAGRLAWYVDNRLVARQLDAGSVVIRTAFAAREVLLAQDPGTFTLPPRFESHQMVVVELDHADPDAVRRAIVAAWELQRRRT